MKTLASIATAAVLLSGCSSAVFDQQDDPIVQSLTGQPASFAEKKLGLPNKRNETRSGSQVWVYLDKKKGMGANLCEVTLSIRNDVIENVSVATNEESLFSTVSSSCNRIRKSLGIDA